MTLTGLPSLPFPAACGCNCARLCAPPQLTCSYLQQLSFQPLEERRTELMNQHGFHCRCPRCCAEEEQLSSQDALQQAVEDAVGTAAAIKEVLTPKGGQAGSNGSSKGGRSGGSSMTGSQEESGRWVAGTGGVGGWGCGAWLCPSWY
jgi:hypothetical protein